MTPPKSNKCNSDAMASFAGPAGSVSPEQLEESGLHWVLCGGMHVGHTVQPKVWRLRPKDEVAREAQRAKDLQRLASAARLIHAVSLYFGDSCEHDLAKRVRAWISPNAPGERPAGHAHPTTPKTL
jgi:hypothetical protein